MGLRGFEFLFEVGSEITGPILHPHIHRGQRQKVFQEEEENGEGVVARREIPRPSPLAGARVEGPDGLTRQHGGEAGSLAATVGSVPPPGVGVGLDRELRLVALVGQRCGVSR